MSIKRIEGSPLERVDLVLKAKYIVVPWDSRVIVDGAIAVDHGKVVGIGREDEVTSKYRGEEVIERRHHVVLPGFIDGHVHTQQLFLRTSISDYDLQLPHIWTEVLIPFEKMLSREEAYLSSLSSILQMIRYGVTFFIEACAPYPEELVKAIKETGVKGVVTLASYDIYKEETIDYREIVRRTEDLIRKYHRPGDNVYVWVSIREIMMSTPELLEALRDLALKYKTGITYHLGEYQGEVDYSLLKYGRRPLEYFEEIGLTMIKPTVIAHGVFFSDHEIEIVRSRGLVIAWCPTIDSIYMAPHWLAYKYPRYENYVLCSDGGGFSKLDLLHEAKIAKTISKTINTTLVYDKTSLDSYSLLKALTNWKTIISVKELPADLVVIDLEKPLPQPIHSPVEAIIDFVEGENVNDVLVNGKFLLRNKQYTKIDIEKINTKIRNIIPELEEKIRELKRKLRPPKPFNF